MLLLKLIRLLGCYSVCANRFFLDQHTGKHVRNTQQDNAVEARLLIDDAFDSVSCPVSATLGTGQLSQVAEHQVLRAKLSAAAVVVQPSTASD